MEEDDFTLALRLYQEDLQSSSSVNILKTSKSEHEKDLSIVDPSWELIDPVPDIRELFVQFNAAYFDGLLASVEVKWSKRMTLCAGLCCYEGRGGLCVIKLSQPLLTLRPRKDLVETLLHEMIHALLFVTNNNKDHDGHGPEFHKHMYRINNQTGTNITVYHSFHDEVNEYRKHWWRCDGPCVKRPPFFGIVRRAMNRAPSPRDTWWNDHQRKCGGTFTKIKEPTKPVKEKRSKANEDSDKKEKTKPGVDKTSAITNWFPKNSSQNNGSSAIITSKGLSESQNEIFQSSSANSSSNIYGFKMSANNKPPPVVVASFSGEGRKLGETNTSGKFDFLAKIEANMKHKKMENKAYVNVNVGRNTQKSKEPNIIPRHYGDKFKSSVIKTKNTRNNSSRFDTNSKGQSSNVNSTRQNIPTSNTPLFNQLGNREYQNKNKRIIRSSDGDEKEGIVPNKKMKPEIHIIEDEEEAPTSTKHLVDCPACPAQVAVEELNTHLDVCLQL